MSQHADILDERERSLSRPLVFSLGLHAGIVLVSMAFTWYQIHYAVQWGSEHALGGAIGVEAVDKIPLPNRGVIPNRLANQTDSSVPSKPEKIEKKKAEPDDPDAISLKREKRTKKQVESEVAQLRKHETVPERPNQVYSQTGSALNSPDYGKQGIHGVGLGESTIAGRGCGGFLELIRARIQQRWDMQPLSSGIRSTVSVNLVLTRPGGSPREVSVLQGSGNSEIDFAARRTILEASPFPPFLPNCEGNEARIEVRFQPKR